MTAAPALASTLVMISSIKKWIGRILEWFRPTDRRRLDPMPTGALPRKSRKIRTWTLKAVLESLDAEHSRYKLRYSDWSNIYKGDWKALRAMGALVLPHSAGEMLPPGFRDVPLPEVYRKPGTLPALMHIGLPEIGAQDKEWLPATAVFAIRQPRSLDWRIEHRPGIPYFVGVVYALSGKEICIARPVYVDINQGTIKAAKLFHHEDISVGKCRYARPSFSVPQTEHVDSYQRMGAEHGFSREDWSAWVIEANLHLCLNVWAKRKNYYQVATARKHSRVTFCVASGEQVPFFRDRELTAIAADGKRKRIVHYVSDHARANGQRVRAHLRGIRRFRWHDYKVAITVPKFHVTTFDFACEPLAEIPNQNNGMPISEAAYKLATAEDALTYRHGER